jgi:membrane fusion protein, macrolide-specific efflux system
MRPGRGWIAGLVRNPFDLEIKIVFYLPPDSWYHNTYEQALIFACKKIATQRLRFSLHGRKTRCSAMNLISRPKSSRNGMPGVRILLAALSAAIMLTAGCSMLPQEEATLAPPLKVPEKITFETLEVKKATIERKIRVTGRFMSVSQSNIQFTERGGRLKIIKVKLGQKVKKGDILATLDTATLNDDIKLQNIALERAQLAYNEARRVLVAESAANGSNPDLSRVDAESRKKQLQYNLDMARLDVEANDIRLQTLTRALNEADLVSPIDGDVIYVTDAKVGDWIETYSTVVTVADPEKLQLRYSDDRVGDFVTGMKVSVTIDETTYDGEVVMTPVDLPIDAKESMKNTVLVAVTGLPADTRIGGEAQIMAILEKSENTIVLPKYALNKNFGRTYVNVLKNNIREERDVEVGIQADTEVEILKGLDIGELVIIR